MPATATHLKRRKEDHVDNVWELIALLIKKPKVLVTVGIFVLAIIAFSTIQITYQDGKWIWTKVPMNKIINSVVSGVGK